MALSLAMYLSGMEQQYFYDVGAKDLYDISANLMAGVTLNPDNPNLLLAKFQSIDCDNITGNKYNRHNNETILKNGNNFMGSIILNSRESGSASPSSTSSGFVSDELMDDISTTNAVHMTENRFFNFHIPPPAASFNTILSKTSSVPPQFEEYSTTNYKNNKCVGSDMQNNFTFVKRTIKNDSTSIAKTSNHFFPENNKNDDNVIRHRLGTLENNTNNNITSNIPHEKISKNSFHVPYNHHHAMLKKTVTYQNRNILDLGSHIIYKNSNNWNYTPAQLKTGNSRFFFENRSQYHRLATNIEEYANDDFLEPCDNCGFLVPTFRQLF